MEVFVKPCQTQMINNLKADGYFLLHNMTNSGYDTFKESPSYTSPALKGCDIRDPFWHVSEETELLVG